MSASQVFILPEQAFFRLNVTAHSISLVKEDWRDWYKRERSEQRKKESDSV
jgi:hypothetical protein